MRAVQQAIVGVGLTLVAVVAMALLIPRSAGPDPASQPSTQATGPRAPLADVPAGPPEPVDAAEDTSVGTLPPPDASLVTEMVSRDLLAPAGPAQDAPNTRAPSDGKTLGARKARAANKPAKNSAPAFPEHDFTVGPDGWKWGDWDEWRGADARYGDERDDDSDDCRREDRHDRHDRFDRRYGCDDRDRRDGRDGRD